MSAHLTARLTLGLFRNISWPWSMLAHYWHTISMQSYLAAQYWLENLGAERESCASPAVSFTPDRDFSGQGFRNAIINSNHSQSDYALVLNMPLSQAMDAPGLHLSKGGRREVLRTYINHLVCEIRLLGNLIAKNRQLSCLYWPAEMTRLLEPAEMTEILYHINRNFKVRQDQSVRFVFELPDLPQDDGLIALARGLGFTDIFFSNFTGLCEYQPKDLRDFVQLLRRYGFRSVSTCLDYRNLKKRNELEKIARRAADLKLNTICLTPHPAYANTTPAPSVNHKQLDLATAVARLEPVLSKKDYQRIGNNFFDSQFAPPPAVQNVFGLGLGAVSIIDNMFGINVDQLDQYYGLLDRQQLPFGSGGYIQTSRN